MASFAKIVICDHSKYMPVYFEQKKKIVFIFLPRTTRLPIIYLNFKTPSPANNLFTYRFFNGFFCQNCNLWPQ